MRLFLHLNFPFSDENYKYFPFLRNLSGGQQEDCKVPGNAGESIQSQIVLLLSVDDADFAEIMEKVGDKSQIKVRHH